MKGFVLAAVLAAFLGKALTGSSVVAAIAFFAVLGFTALVIVGQFRRH